MGIILDKKYYHDFYDNQLSFQFAADKIYILSYSIIFFAYNDDVHKKKFRFRKGFNNSFF